MHYFITRRVLLVFLLLGLLPASLPAAAQSSPDRFVPGADPPAPPTLGFEMFQSDRPSLNQATGGCVQKLTDEHVSLSESAPTPWIEYRRTRTIDTNVGDLASGSIRFDEDNDGELDAEGRDIDSAGQEISVPIGVSSIYADLFYRYETGTTVTGDRLDLELYRVGQLGAGTLITSKSIDVANDDDGTWREATWIINSQQVLDMLIAAGHVVFLVTMRSGVGGPAQQAWVDDITLDVCAPATSITGKISQATVASPNLSDARLLLTRTNTAGTQLLLATNADAVGNYSFGNVPALASGESDRVWFVNATPGVTRDERRLGFWAGPRYSSGGTYSGGVFDFDISDVGLSGPASYSQVVATDSAPVTLSWSGRGASSDRYQLCLYDPQRIDGSTGLPPQVCGEAGPDLSFNLSPASFSKTPDFRFSYGRSYRWYVVVTNTNKPGQYGYSFYERAITLLPEQPTGQSPETPGGSPASASGADWTVLLYLAGDNALGDPLRASALARLDRQLTLLSSVASQYPTVHILALLDTYGNGGSQLCYLDPGGSMDCHAQGELNMGLPATLANFIATGLSSYPASHTLLAISGPGNSISGIGSDETSRGASLDVAGLRTAFSQAGLGSSRSKLDIVFYRGSEMGTIEVAAATAPYAGYMVAPADQYWSAPLFERILPLLTGPQKDLPAEVSRGIVQAYDSSIAGYGNTRARSMAAYNLSGVANVIVALNSLGNALQSALGSQSTQTRTILGTIRSAVQAYDSSGNGMINRLLRSDGVAVVADEDAVVDLTRLAEQLRDAPGIADGVSGAAGALIDALDGTPPLVMLSQQVSGTGALGGPVLLNDASGIGVFFPTGARLGGQPTLMQLYMYGPVTGEPRDGAWAGFLRSYLLDQIGSGIGGVTAGPTGGSQFRASSGGLIKADLHMPMMRR